MGLALAAVPLVVIGAAAILYGLIGTSYCGFAQPEAFIGLGIIFVAAAIAMFGQFIASTAVAVAGVVLFGIGIAGLVAGGCRFI